MVAIPKQKMTVDEYLAWAEGKPGRYELYAGTVYAMAPERTRHGEVKFAVQAALLAGIRKAGLACHMLPDGMTVRINKDTAHEPDALIYCGSKLPGNTVEVPSPIILVEVLSPSTRYIDASAKLGGYFSLPSVRHYLIVDPDKPLVIHHRRETDRDLATRIINSGPFTLDPPGLDVSVKDFYPAAD